MTEAYICDYIRTPIGRFGGSLSSVRTDDLAAIPLQAKGAKTLYFNHLASVAPWWTGVCAGIL